MTDPLDAEKRAELDGLAEQIRGYAARKPTHTVSTLAKKLGVSEQLVGEVIDSYLVTGDTVAYAGRGQGGGWIPEEIRQTLVTGYSLDDAEHIGFRWPDGSLHSEQYHEEEVTS